MTLAEIAAATGGRLVPGRDGDGRRHAVDPAALVVDGPVVSDSRECGPGGLYVARIGEHADGHDFAGDAAARGAVAVLGSRAVDVAPTVVVDDVQQAFADLAHEVLRRCAGLVTIGITGSSGKTTTKDLLAAVLRGAGEVVAPVGSLNSEVGVPLTACRVTPTTRYLVAEMGASGVGHIAYLTTIAPPSIGVVLNVGSAHLGPFGSREAIAETKGALVEALPPTGVAVLNADDALVSGMAARTRARVHRVGTGPEADLRATDVTLAPTGHAAFGLAGTLPTPQGTVAVPPGTAVRLAVPGGHQVHNALAVLAAATAAGMDPDAAVAAIAAARLASRWRMEVFELADGVTLVNDAYNANPESMAASLRALAAMTAGSGTGGAHRRSVAVLGAMRELGEESDALHAATGRLVAELGTDVLVVVGGVAGGPAAGIADGAEQAGGPQVHRVEDPAAARALLDELLAPGDVVLFKSSRDSHLRHLGDDVARSRGADVGGGAAG